MTKANDLIRDAVQKRLSYPHEGDRPTNCHWYMGDPATTTDESDPPEEFERELDEVREEYDRSIEREAARQFAEWQAEILRHENGGEG